MSEDYSEEFVVEEGGANRAFLILAGSLIGLFILIALFVLGITLAQRGDQAEAVAARETENAVILATNAEVTRQVAARQTEEARPTETSTPEPTPPPTNTPAPSPTVAATETESEAEAAAETPDAQLTATAEAEAAATAAANATATAQALAGDSGDGEGTTTLPETGVSAWTIVAAAGILLALLLVSRRLRTK